MAWFANSWKRIRVGVDPNSLGPDPHFQIQRLNRLRKKCLPRGSLTSAAKAGVGNGPVTAALKRCATQNQVLHRVFPQPVAALGACALAACLKACPDTSHTKMLEHALIRVSRRSEERRVGKEGRSRWSPDH